MKPRLVKAESCGNLGELTKEPTKEWQPIRKHKRKGGWRKRFKTKQGNGTWEEPSLVIWNARGLMARGGHKLTEVSEMALATRVKVIVITETHFDHDAGFDTDVRAQPARLPEDGQ